MMTTTPIGVEIFFSLRPFGRVRWSRIRPTGSGSAARSRSAWPIAAMRLSSSWRRSSRAEDRPICAPERLAHCGDAPVIELEALEQGGGQTHLRARFQVARVGFGDVVAVLLQRLGHGQEALVLFRR